MKEKYRKLIIKAIVIGCLALFIAALSLLKQTEAASENFFARGISRAYMLIMGNIASWFPFSLFDIFVTFGILTLVICIPIFIIHLKKKRPWKAINLIEKVVIAALCVTLVYTAVASGNYYREEVPLAKYEGEQLSKEETKELVKVMLDDFSEVSGRMNRREDGTTICPYTFNELTERIRDEYKKLDDDYFPQYVPSAKEGWYSKFLTSEGITGITFLPTGDAVVNAETPGCYKTVTTAHELAHTLGVMREGDANMMAYYILLSSDDDYFRYCAYMYGISHLTSVLYQLSPELYSEVMQGYPKAAQKERTAENNFWMERYSFMEEVGDFLNDLYLKMSGADNGTDSYHDYSNYTVRYDEETKEVIEVKVHYSTTTRVLLKIAQDRKEKVD